MSELKFCCPGCNQKIQCDEQWGGRTIQCPACQAEILVPLSSAPVAAAQPPTPAAQPRLTLARPHPQSSPGSAPLPATPPAPKSPHPPSAPRSRREPGKSGAGKLLKTCLAVVVVGAGSYFGFTLVSSWQNKFDKKSDEIAKNSGGGEMGHIANLYQVLDATDPNRHQVPTAAGPGASLAQAEQMAHLATGGSVARTTSGRGGMPLLPPVWTLDLATANIPNGRANGVISGSKFVLDFARMDKAGPAYVLSLGEGSPASPDRELLVYLHLNAGEGLFGQTWTVSKEMAGANVPQVIERWKTDPRYAPQEKVFNSGYAMKLQFGQVEADGIQAGIFIALPDAGQSVVAGRFELSAASAGMN